MPVFFLYLQRRVDLAEVFWLEAVYYVSVVLLEVPSGYLSDRVGRRPTLIAAALSLLLSYVIFMLAHQVWSLALAQGLLAAGIALGSGTETSLHLASLEALDQAHDYGEREARISALLWVVSASAALLGGLLGLIDLRAPYALSALGAALALGVALRLHEVRDAPEAQPGPMSITQAWRECMALHQDRRLAWLFGVGVLAILANHVPYELYQPYLKDLLGATRHTTPLWSGLHMAAAALLAAPVAGQSTRLAQRVGLTRLLLGSLALTWVMVAAMACWSSLWVATALVMRTLPRALQEAPLRQALAPHIPDSHRATYLSLQSLAGRLAFAGMLGLWAIWAAEGVALALRLSAWLLGVLWLAFWAMGRRGWPPKPRP